MNIVYATTIQTIRATFISKSICVYTRSVNKMQSLHIPNYLLKNTIWAEELGKLVDEVGSFNDIDAMKIMKKQLSDIPALKPATRESCCGA